MYIYIYILEFTGRAPRGLNSCFGGYVSAVARPQFAHISLSIFICGWEVQASDSLVRSPHLQSLGEVFGVEFAAFCE